ncbi:sporulation protein YhbH [Melghirimyces algeriensis]|uniref:Sporulation protein YhbH n=1 Tax=Melghirimyces algeriensis TaxID=910412 RepID=A0A521FAI9_9BACL|nr:sporulation protein YhbH [Melghirimyces algeriensis]
MDGLNFIISREDWSLHRKGYQDQMRHQKKVKEAIRENLSDLINEESIILSDGQKVMKIPIRSMEEYHFRYDANKGKHVGQGAGKSQVGDVIGREPVKAGAGKGEGAGDAPGQDYYEAEVSMEELENILFSEMELPRLEQKEPNEVEVKDIRFNDVRKKGLIGNIDKKRTLLESLKRNAMKGQRGFPRISDDDLRFKTWEDITIPHSNAVVLAMMDTSGSLGMS